MIQPTYLKAGDTVAIVCTARKFSLEEAQPAIELMESWGLKVLLGNTIGLNNYQLGGLDHERADDLNTMLANDEVKAIWCARGGYGTVRIIDTIDFNLLHKNPKWIIGFSDSTVLHNQIHNEGIETLHGIMAFSVPNASEKSKESLKNALFGERVNYKIDSCPYNRIGTGKGQLVGGNLSIIYSLLGSESSIDTKGKILFIEDLDEYLYHIDRMLYNLKRNGYFDEIQGLIVGSMTDMHDNSIPFGQDAIQIITAITAEYNFPIVFDFPAGHGKENLTLKLGSVLNLKVKEKKTILKWE